MRYVGGGEIRLWDRVEAWPGNPGIVVSADTDEFAPQYPSDWAYLRHGVLVDAREAGLMHYSEPDMDLRFVSRGEEPLAAEWAVLHPKAATTSNRNDDRPA